MMIDYTDDGDEDGYDDVDDDVPLNKNLNFPQFCLNSTVPKKSQQQYILLLVYWRCTNLHGIVAIVFQEHKIWCRPILQDMMHGQDREHLSGFPNIGF